MGEAGRRREVNRRRAIALLGGGTLLGAGGVLLARRQPPWRAAWTAAGPASVPRYRLNDCDYAPDGTAGRTAAFPLSAVRLLDSAFRGNQGRNLDYLLFLDLDRMLHTFRLNYGQPSDVLPCGGWESPNYQVRGHTTGHLLSGLALTYANTGSEAARAAGEYLVRELAALQSLAPAAGYSPGYLSAFPEYFFDWLEEGRHVWSPYYMIHKYLAGMIDQYQLAGVGEALDVAERLADWVDARTSRLSYAHMQRILEVEFGGLPEALVNLYSITGRERYLATAQRFYHAAFLDPLAAGIDDLHGQQCNVNTPKVIACLRMWEETGEAKYHDIAVNFWQMAAEHHSYVIGGQGNHEHWGPPDTVAGTLTNYNCEGCVTYNMLKLTRLLLFHQLSRTDLIDYYERGLFNQMLGTQDPDSPHGFVCYYTGLAAGAFKQQPLNYFPHGNPDVYSTDYGDFTCDNATGLETQAKFADTIYTRDETGVYVNLFIPSEVHCADENITLRQSTGFPDDPVTRLEVVSGSAPMAIRVRVPAWTAGTPHVVLNGRTLAASAVSSAPGTDGQWVTVSRLWETGDRLEVTLPMRLEFCPAPDDASVQAVTYGPVVLSGLYGASHPAGKNPDTRLPLLDTASVGRVGADPMTFAATAEGTPVTMVPVARAQHEHFTVYWQTELSPPPVTATGITATMGAA